MTNQGRDSNYSGKSSFLSARRRHHGIRRHSRIYKTVETVGRRERVSEAGAAKGGGNSHASERGPLRVDELPGGFNAVSASGHSGQCQAHRSVDDLNAAEEAGGSRTQHHTALSQARGGGVVIPERAKIIVPAGNGIEVQRKSLIERGGEPIS